MKWIKKFEARYRNREFEQKPENMDEQKKYLERCQDIDDKCYITFDEFVSKLDFNMFSKYSETYYQAGIAIKHGTNHGSTTLFPNAYVLTSEYGNFNYDLKSLKEWQQRNCFIYAEVNSGGASGGSCWDEADDPGAQPYEGETLDMQDFIFNYLKPKLEIILNNYANEKSAKELCDILYNKSYNIIHEGDRSEYEYYGNYQDYASYWITMEDLFIFLSENGSF